jgi:hypothetical protein
VEGNQRCGTATDIIYVPIRLFNPEDSYRRGWSNGNGERLGGICIAEQKLFQATTDVSYMCGA